MKKLIVGLLIVSGLVMAGYGRAQDWSTADVTLTTVESSSTAPWLLSGIWFQADQNITFNIRGENYFLRQYNDIDMYPLVFAKGQKIKFGSDGVGAGIKIIWYSMDRM